MKLWAISDLHLSVQGNRDVVERFPAYPDDWLIVAGDVSDGYRDVDRCFDHLARKFRQVIWVPGNHELWSRPDANDELRGVALYHHLVNIARSHGILTPEDPFPVFPHPTGDLLVAPLFLLYDYSFRPEGVALEDVVAWADEEDVVAADEYFLHPDPFPNRISWCAERIALTMRRLVSCPPDLPKVLINHFPLEESLAVLPRVPRFAPWCGTRRSQGWHIRFNARAVIYGHLHIPGTTWLDGVPFQEVSLGYPRQWRRELGIGNYLREVELSPKPSPPSTNPS